MHYAVSIVMAVWLDTYFFVWPQNGNAFVFYNRLLLLFNTHTKKAYHSHLHSNGLELARKKQFN